MPLWGFYCGLQVIRNRRRKFYNSVVSTLGTCPDCPGNCRRRASGMSQAAYKRRGPVSLEFEHSVLLWVQSLRCLWLDRGEFDCLPNFIEERKKTSIIILKLLTWNLNPRTNADLLEGQRLKLWSCRAENLATVPYSIALRKKRTRERRRKKST